MRKIRAYGERWRAESAFYSLEFESHAAYGAFNDAMIGSEWWNEQIIKAAGSAYPTLKNLGTTVYYDAIEV